MNDELIFVKTVVGEDAVRDRTRLVQRNLRMVLILVDGLTNVGVLKQKAGDQVMIETALAELERIGLIESQQTRGARQANAVAVALSSSPSPTAPQDDSDSSSFGDFPAGDTIFDDSIAATQERIGPDRIGSDIVPAADDAPFRTPRGASHEDDTSQQGWLSGVQQRWSHMREEQAFERAYGKPGDSSGAGGGSPIHRRHKSMRKTVITWAVFGLLIMGIARTLFYPYDELRPEAEARLRQMFGVEEVMVGNVRLAFAPLPKLIMEQVVIGSHSDATADSVAMSPAPGILLGGDLFREIRVSGLTVREPFIAGMSRWFSRESIDGLGVRKVEVDRLSLDLGWTVMTGLSGSIMLAPDEGVSKFHGNAGALQWDATPTSTGVQISARAGQWTAPINPPVDVAALDFSGILSPGGLSITKMDIRAFDGQLTGKGSVTWQSSPRMKLDLDAKHLDAEKLLKALHAPALLAGELAGQAQLLADPPSSEWLNKDARLDGSVSVAHGSVERIDLTGALRAGDGNNASRRGGDTGFEDLVGKVSVDSTSVRLSGVRLSSGLMLATGQAVAARQAGTISGAVNVELRGTANARRAAMTLSGSARDPDLKIVR